MSTDPTSPKANLLMDKDYQDYQEFLKFKQWQEMHRTQQVRPGVVEGSRVAAGYY